MSVTQILSELSLIIPDQAYLIQLSIEKNTVEVLGFAENASDLIAFLDRSQIFFSPIFISPMTFDTQTDHERFHLRFNVEGDLE